MSFWIVLWKYCLIGSLAAFAVMSILVTVGGAFDIAKLIKRLREETPDDEESVEESVEPDAADGVE